MNQFRNEKGFSVIKTIPRSSRVWYNTYRIKPCNTLHYPMMSFGNEGVEEYDNIEVKDEVLSPEKKRNILLARKKDILRNFFLVAGTVRERSDIEVILSYSLNLY